MHEDVEEQFLSGSRTKPLFGGCLQNWCSSEVSDLSVSYIRSHQITTVQLSLLGQPKEQIKSNLR